MANPLPNELAEMGLEVKGLSARQKTLGMRFWTAEDFPGQHPVQLDEMFQLGQLPPGKFLALEVSPVGLTIFLGFLYFRVNQTLGKHLFWSPNTNTTRRTTDNWGRCPLRKAHR